MIPSFQQTYLLTKSDLAHVENADSYAVFFIDGIASQKHVGFETLANFAASMQALGFVSDSQKTLLIPHYPARRTYPVSKVPQRRSASSR